MGSWVLKTDSVERWAYWDDIFTEDECDQIIRIGTQMNLMDATLGDGSVIKETRNSKVRFIGSEEMRWVYERVTHIVNHLNEECFGFDLFSFGEDLQFTEYEAPVGMYTTHVDKFMGGVPRKLSIVIQLSDPKLYEGGDFQLMDSKDPFPLPRTRGTLLAFPSFTPHRVTEVTKGTRYSLVGWITGPKFK